jgi:hypothetical protein
MRLSHATRGTLSAVLKPCRSTSIAEHWIWSMKANFAKADDHLYGISLMRNSKSTATSLLRFTSPHFHLTPTICNPGTIMLPGSKSINKKGEHNPLKTNTGKCTGKSKAHYHTVDGVEEDNVDTFTLCKVRKMLHDLAGKFLQLQAACSQFPYTSRQFPHDQACGVPS